MEEERWAISRFESRRQIRLNFYVGTQLMAQKTFAAIILALFAVFAFPTFANASGFVPEKVTSASTAVVVPATQANLAGGAATLTVAIDAGASEVARASAGYDSPVLFIWIISGVLLLGAALAVVMSIVRREHANARARSTQSAASSS